MVLLGVGVDQGGVDVNHVVTGIGSRFPGRPPGGGPGGMDGVESRLVNRLQGPPGGGQGGHLTEQARLVAQDGQVGDGGGTVGQGHGQIHQHPAPVPTPATLLGRGHRHRQGVGETHPVGQIGQKSGPDMGHDSLAAGGHSEPGSGRTTVHLGSALLFGILMRRNISFSQQEGVFADRAQLQPVSY